MERCLLGFASHVLGVLTDSVPHSQWVQVSVVQYG